MTYADLRDALGWLSDEHGLDDTPVYFSGRRGAMESAAHELAHAIDLGDSTLDTYTIGERIGALGDRAADQHELRTLRIERSAMLRLGMRVDIHKIARGVDWRRGVNPPRSAVDAPLTKRERRGVRRFLALVQHAHQETR